MYGTLPKAGLLPSFAESSASERRILNSTQTPQNTNTQILEFPVNHLCGSHLPLWVELVWCGTAHPSEGLGPPASPVLASL